MSLSSISSYCTNPLKQPSKSKPAKLQATRFASRRGVSWLALPVVAFALLGNVHADEKAAVNPPADTVVVQKKTDAPPAEHLSSEAKNRLDAERQKQIDLLKQQDIMKYYFFLPLSIAGGLYAAFSLKGHAATFKNQVVQLIRRRRKIAKQK